MGRAPRVGAARENFPSSSREPDGMTRSSSMSSSQRTVAELKDQLGWSTYQWRLFMITGLCIMAESIEVSLLSFLTIECKKEWALTDVQADHIAGSVFVGEICGCLLFGIFADVCGRKPAFALGVFLVAVFGIASAFSQNVDELILYRFGCGLGIGGFSVPYDLLCEFCPNGSRGVAMMSLWIWWTFGSFMVVQIAANTVETSGWRVLTLYCAVPPVLSMLGLFWVDESPNWLVIKSRRKEAEEIFQKAAILNGVNLGDVELEEEEHASLDMRILFTGGNALRTTCLWICSFAQTFVYYGVVLYLPRAFVVLVSHTDVDVSTTSEEMSSAYPYWALFASCAGELAANLLCLILVQTFSRSKVISTFFAGFAVTFPVIIMDVPDVIMVLFAMLARLCATTSGNLTWLVTPEAYLTQVRATGHSWANMMARFGAVVTTYWASYRDTTIVFVGYSLVAVAGAIAAFLLPPGVMPGSNPFDTLDRAGRVVKQS